MARIAHEYISTCSCHFVLQEVIISDLYTTGLIWFQQYFSYIMPFSFINGGNQNTRRKPLTCRKSLTNFITKCCIEYTWPWAGFELTTLVVIGTDCTGSWNPTTIWSQQSLHVIQPLLFTTKKSSDSKLCQYNKGALNMFIFYSSYKNVLDIYKSLVIFHT